MDSPRRPVLAAWRRGAADLNGAPQSHRPGCSRAPPANFSRAALLFDLLVAVVQRYEPEVAAVLREERTTADMPASPACAHAAGPGHLVPVARDRRTEPRHAQSPGGRTRTRLRAAARHLRWRIRSRCGRRHYGGRRSVQAFVRPARAAGDHRPSDRGQARHSAGAASAHLPAPARSRIAALDTIANARN